MPIFSFSSDSLESSLAIIEDSAPVVKENDMTPMSINTIQKQRSLEF